MAFYERIADYYDEIFPLNTAQREFVLESVEPDLGKSILDVGCGNGALLRRLAAEKVFERALGVDVSDEGRCD